MSISHNNDMSGVIDGCLPCSVCTVTWDPTPGVHVKLGHAQWPIAEEIRRNRSTVGRGRQGVQRVSKLLQDFHFCDCHKSSPVWHLEMNWKWTISL